MEYFILEVNTEYTAPEPIAWYGKLDDRSLRNKKYCQISKRLFFTLTKHMQMVFTDIILHPCLMVSKEAMKAIQLYEPFLRFTRVILFDGERKRSQAYYIPFLEEIDCLTKESRFNQDKSIIHHAQVDGNKMKEKALIRVSNVNCICILIRLDLAESLLRRGMIGIGLKETDTIYLEEKYKKERNAT